MHGLLKTDNIPTAKKLYTYFTGYTAGSPIINMD